MKTIKERAQSLLDQWREASDWNESVSALLRELIDAPEPEPVACDLRMSAYYYNFDGTGVPSIDRILSAVACAGKAYHHTEYWDYETAPYVGHVGTTPVEWIQNAANDAAKVYAAPPTPSVPVLTVECEPDYWSGGHYHEGTMSYIDPTAVWKLPIGTELYTAPPAPSVPDADLVRDAELHPDDIAVDIFAKAMKAKMAKQRAKGYDGWQDKEKFHANRLRNLLIDHVTKGDPVDVGNFAMMLFNRGDSTAACKTCGGTGQCDDAYLGGIGYNSWPCPDCAKTVERDKKGGAA